MKPFTLQKLAGTLVAFSLTAPTARAQVQQGFQLLVRPSASSVSVGNSFTYTVDLTNLSGFTLSDLWVTNAFSAPVSFGAVNFTVGNGVNYTGSSSTSSNALILDFHQFSPALLSSGSAEATFTVVPQSTGFRTNGVLTDAVVATAPALLSMVNTLTTNVLVQVTNNVFNADLSVALSGLGAGILAGDFVTYTVNVTNHGPGSVTNVVVTNTLPRGTSLLSISPTNQTSTLTNGNLVLDLGRLAQGGFSVVHLTVQSTNTGSEAFSASVGAEGLQDPQRSNNTSSVTVDITTGITGQIIATNASAMTLNPQTGLMDQTVRLLNLGTSSVPSVRLTISGLTNWLYNATGTNYGNPFVVYANAIPPDQSVDFVLEYFVPSRSPILVANTNYSAVGVPMPSLEPPSSTNGTFSITRTVQLANGNLLIEFPSVPGASYWILYSSDASFTNVLTAEPPVSAPADRVQWIDDGPPKTIRPPQSDTSRFYRVLKN